MALCCCWCCCTSEFCSIFNRKTPTVCGLRGGALRGHFNWIFVESYPAQKCPVPNIYRFFAARPPRRRSIAPDFFDSPRGGRQVGRKGKKVRWGGGSTRLGLYMCNDTPRGSHHQRYSFADRRFLSPDKSAWLQRQRERERLL